MLIACLVFVIIFVPIFRLYSEQGLAQQKLIRDYGVAINIAENALNLIENEIEAGRFNANITDEDVTSVVLGNQAAQDAIKNFLGDADPSTKYIPRFQILLTARPQTADLVELRLKFLWGRTLSDGQFKVEHQFVLSTLKAKR